MPNEIYRAMEEGFRQPIEYSRIGVPQNVLLVNSVAAAEFPRIYSFVKKDNLMLKSSSSPMKNSKSNLIKIIENIPSGHLLI